MASVLVAGASGYTGALAARLIDRHPHFELAAVTSRSDAGRRLDDLYPHHRVPRRPGGARPRSATATSTPRSSPTRTARRRRWSPQLRERGVKVVDLSADFRLRDVATYERWYVEHPHPELIAEAVYGLPELHRDEIAGAGLVANPGCYPTATLLALAPLRGHRRDVVVDAKSGVSGAGRAATETTHFVAADENVTPYGVGAHRHMPEIDAAARRSARPVTFTPHLLPLDQGELVSCYVTVEADAGDVAARFARLLRRRAVRRGRRPPAGRARRARHELLRASTCRRRAHRQGLRLRRDRQHLEGLVARRPCRTST